ncbi:hypothetical protein SAMN03159343_3005 [Klenkia marina]|uniref:Cobyrinic acid a,c-diamide synthase n=1 Tax=Klenkia marina TaxID=1960309 RepID=A0A1G4YKT6_9ACTN|nr:hypothetical protein [Klenkia marina]SCX54101.1 hypothetical protein SAMN03159343_3005 [Klenkia marina]
MTRRPVLPGASELFFRRTDAAAAEAADAAPVSQLPTLAAAAASPSLRGNAKRTAEPVLPAADAVAQAPAASPFQLIQGDRTDAARDEMASLRALPTTSRTRSRVKHEEKITVYCSAEELLALETARLSLRGDHGVVADRGRIVREAIAVLLADLDANGESSVLVQRLRR